MEEGNKRSEIGTPKLDIETKKILNWYAETRHIRNKNIFIGTPKLDT